MPARRIDCFCLCPYGKPQPDKNQDEDFSGYWPGDVKIWRRQRSNKRLSFLAKLNRKILSMI